MDMEKRYLQALDLSPGFVIAAPILVLKLLKGDEKP
jgi:hypothetical protein